MLLAPLPGIQIYSCDPQSPWQRGTNENANRLLRQYWPTGAELRQLTQTKCDDLVGPPVLHGLGFTLDSNTCSSIMFV